MRDDESDQTDLWDPIWEFILDDYDEEPVKTKSRFRFRREKEEVQEPGLLGMMFDAESDSEFDGRSERGFWFDSRDESNEAANNGQAASSNSNNQVSERSGATRSSRWDRFRSDKKQKKKKVAKQSSKSRQRVSLSRDESQRSASDYNSTKKRVGIFGRLRRRKREEARQTVRSAVIYEPAIPEGEPVNTQRDGTESVQERNVDSVPKVVSPPSQKIRSDREKPREELKKAPKPKRAQNAEALDPFLMLLEVAEKLDPFASDEDSESGSSMEDSESASEIDTVSGTEASESVLGELEEDPSVDSVSIDLLPPKKEQAPKGAKFDFESKASLFPEQRQNVTEILLNFKPMSEEEELDALVQSRAVTSEQTWLDSIAETRDQSISFTRDDAFTREAFPSDEEVESQPSEDEQSEGEEPREQERSLLHDQRAGLGRLVCRSRKNTSNQVFHQLQRADAKEVFPATRMVSNDNTESSAVTGQGADYVNGVMGVPSDRFLTASGPQSLYAYDYEKGENMDVYYPTTTKTPRTSLVVRKRGMAPSLSPSTLSHQVLVQVEAATVSETDCLIRQGNWWGSELAPKANTPGIDIVGKVIQVREKTESQYKIKARQTVLSLVKWGGNSRYRIVHADKLVRVPDSVDPAEAACLPETYLTAFQVLHQGQGMTTRYKESSLRGKSILIVGSMSNNVGKAIVELALNAGVANIYATAKKKHWKNLISFGVMPLSQEPHEWISRIEGTIDLVLACNSSLREPMSELHYRTLRPREGQIIFCGYRAGGNDIPVSSSEKPANLVCTSNKAFTRIMNRSCEYDVYEQWENKRSMCKRDLEHLLNLLERGVIKPKVLDRIPLSKVGRAQEMIESKRLDGFLVCEPWMKSKNRAVYL